MAQQKVVVDLITILGSHPDWAQLLEKSLQEADVEGVKTLDEYLNYLNDAVQMIPMERDLFQ